MHHGKNQALFPEFPEYGSPQDRGSCDAYYGRMFRPHKYPQGRLQGGRVTELTQQEIAEYTYGYENQDDRKDWGI
jgi:hypothetical protein